MKKFVLLIISILIANVLYCNSFQYECINNKTDTGSVFQLRNDSCCVLLDLLISNDSSIFETYRNDSVDSKSIPQYAASRLLVIGKISEIKDLINSIDVTISEVKESKGFCNWPIETQKEVLKNTVLRIVKSIDGVFDELESVGYEKFLSDEQKVYRRNLVDKYNKILDDYKL